MIKKKTQENGLVFHINQMITSELSEKSFFSMYIAEISGNSDPNRHEPARITPTCPVFVSLISR